MSQFFLNVHCRRSVKYMDNSPIPPKSFPNFVFSSLMGDFYQRTLGCDYLCVHWTLRGWNGCFSSEMKVTAAADAQGRKNPFRAESPPPSEGQGGKNQFPPAEQPLIQSTAEQPSSEKPFPAQNTALKTTPDLFFNLSLTAALIAQPTYRVTAKIKCTVMHCAWWELVKVTNSVILLNLVLFDWCITYDPESVPSAASGHLITKYFSIILSHCAPAQSHATMYLATCLQHCTVWHMDSKLFAFMCT